MSRLRRLPPVCALASAVWALAGTLRFRRTYVGEDVTMEDGRSFRVFRHLSMDRGRAAPERPAVFVVRFRFARGSERTNRRLSLLPVPVIAGSPGFRAKLWMSDAEGWWQGVYEWESREAIETYRGSLVFRTMERRAAPGTLSTAVIESGSLEQWLVQRFELASAPGDERGTRAVAGRTFSPTQRTIE